MPLDSASSGDVARWMVAFNEIRDADISDEERLIRGGLICEALHENCGGSLKEVQR
ncbi:MAG TPA: hypothetical protein VHK65_03505 [Candidatus Dormibacteraeota bacterium]|nr:hypothetical protein [Candidatus Dormibacteraeota bacterium]